MGRSTTISDPNGSLRNKLDKTVNYLNNKTRKKPKTGYLWNGSKVIKQAVDEFIDNHKIQIDQ